jgi:hypothetical protein
VLLLGRKLFWRNDVNAAAWDCLDHLPRRRRFGECRVGSRVAMLPTTSSAHGKIPPRPPERESASKVVDAATIIPST